jgi:uncharacterized protein
MKTNTRIRRLVLLVIICLGVSSLNAQQVSKKWGKVTCRYENGEKSSRGRVDKAGRTGMWKFWDEQGHLHHTVLFFHDTMNGPYKEYNINKKVVVTGQYERGCKDGVWRFYNDEGKMISENTFDGGKLDGRQTTWFPNGDLREMLVCDDDMIVSRKAWYPGGRIRTVETYKNGLNEGTWFTYPEPLSEEDTFPSATDQYVDGKLHGWHYAFLGGKKIEEIHYLSGEADGTSTRWDEHGHLLCEENFVKGKRDGICTYYDCTQKLRTITYRNGQLHGAKKDYDRAGKLILSTWYNEGYRDSVKTYHGNGQVATCRVYAIGSSGVESSEYTEWDESGTKLLYGRYLGDQKYGEWYTYYTDGRKMSITNYVNGVISGPYTRWYANGNKMVEFIVEEDGSRASIAAWNENGKMLRPGSLRYNELVESANPGEMYNSTYLSNRSMIDKRIAENRPSFFQNEAIENYEISSLNKGGEDNVYPATLANPQFPGGDTAMQKFMDEHIVHPRRLSQMQGTVYVSYIVERDGSVSNLHAVQEVNGAPEFTLEALRVVNAFPLQIPGKIDGEPVRSRVVIPVQFNLR